MAQLWEVDRTSILEAQRCPRSRFYSRHFNGTGIERIKKSLPLAFGSAFHSGAEDLLRGDVEAAVAKAHLYLNLAFSAEAIDLDDKQTEYAINEQKAIAEGLIRGWWAHDGGRFLRDFEVVEVEQEGRATLSGMARRVKLKDDVVGKEYELSNDAKEAARTVFHSLVETVTEPEMVLMFRPDALVRERSSGDLYIVSWKTASTFGQYTINQISSDMQSMSEVWGVEQTHNQNNPFLKIEGVLYLFAVKGQRKLDDYLGFKVQNTPLAYGWVRKGPTEDEDEWAHCYGWATEETNPKTMKLVQTKLGKGFRKVSVWDNYPGGTREWIADLAAQRITPRHINALEGVFPQSMPVSRRQDEIDSWKRQIVAQEERIQEALAKVEFVGETGAPIDHALDRQFPQSTARCFDYMSRCQFYECCFTPAVKSDPLSSGLYKIREANHPSEKGSLDE